MTKEDVLRSTNNGLNVFRYYIKGNWLVGKNFRNPYYDDKNASCCVYLDNRTGLYKVKDFGNPHYAGDCFAFVAQISNLTCERNFVEILEKINHDLGLFIDNTAPKTILPISMTNSALVEVDCSSISTPNSKEFSNEELLFWQRYGIDRKILQKFNVISVASFSGVSKTGNPYTTQASVSQPIFAFQVKATTKYYLPFSSIRFLYANKTEDYIFGLDQLPLKGEMVFITGGEKDVMSLYAKGFAAISFNSETATIPRRVILQISYRFKHIVLLYDCDKTGLEASAKQQQQLKEYGLKRLVLPLSGSKTEKDISDYFALGYQHTDLVLLFIQLLKEDYQNTFALLKPCAIDFNNPPVPPEPLITINNVVLASPSNLLAITGSEGSGKSNYIGAIVAGALCTSLTDQIDTLGTYIAPNIQKKAIILFDTEQTEDQLYRNAKNILRRANISSPPKWFQVFGIGNIGRKDRLKVISESIDSFYYYFGGIHLVVIDGIADLLMSVNDEEGSVMLVEELYRLAGFYKTCIIVVVHLAPSSYKLRGHLGSELQRKAAGILCIEKNEHTGNSFVKAIKVREGNPLHVPNIQFAWDEVLNYHVLVDVATKEFESKINLQELVNDLFKQDALLSYAELCEKIQTKLSIKERQAKNYIKLLREQAIITQKSTKYAISEPSPNI